MKIIINYNGISGLLFFLMSKTYPAVILEALEAVGYHLVPCGKMTIFNGQSLNQVGHLLHSKLLVIPSR